MLSLIIKPNEGGTERDGGGGGRGRLILPFILPLCWFSLNNSETIKAATLIF